MTEKTEVKDEKYRHRHTGALQDCFNPECASPLITKISE